MDQRELGPTISCSNQRVATHRRTLQERQTNRPTERGPAFTVSYRIQVYKGLNYYDQNISITNTKKRNRRESEGTTRRGEAGEEEEKRRKGGGGGGGGGGQGGEKGW